MADGEIATLSKYLASLVHGDSFFKACIFSSLKEYRESAAFVATGGSFPSSGGATSMGAAATGMAAAAEDDDMVDDGFYVGVIQAGSTATIDSIDSTPY
jgi:hypothetical protein